MKETLMKILNGKHTKKWIVVIGIAGILLLLLSELLPAGSKSKQTANAAVMTVAEYESALEARLAQTVERIAGVGRCRIMITLENEGKYVYAGEEKSESDYSSEGDKLKKTDDAQSSVVLIQGESGYDGLLVSKLQPTVRGVTVVCEGGDNDLVRERVTEAVTAVLNVTSKRVCVTVGNFD